MEWKDLGRFFIYLVVIIIVDTTYRYFRGIGITFEGQLTLAIGLTILTAIREQKDA